jgi:hypothetical protein
MAMPSNPQQLATGQERKTQRRLCVVLAFVPLLAVGCFGPTTIRETRARYNDVIKKTSEEELLLNLVRLRYNEHPSFLPVTGLNAQFQLNAGADFRSGPERGLIDNWGGGNLGYSDRPTLTFAPQRPPALTKALLTQVDLDTLYLFAKQGGDIQRVFRLFVRTINGLDNASTGGGPVPVNPPTFGEFRTFASILQSLEHREVAVITNDTQVSEVTDTIPLQKIDTKDLVEIKKAGYGVREAEKGGGYRLTETKKIRSLVINSDVAVRPELQDLLEILSLRHDRDRFPVQEAPEGQFRRGQNDPARENITITTRSILEVMYLLSKTVAVPEDHAHQGIAHFTRNPDGSPFDWGLVSGDLFRVCVSKHKPTGAYVTVKYRDYWYYVDDRDLSSKTTMNLFNELLRLQRIGASEGQPILSLPLSQ